MKIISLYNDFNNLVGHFSTMDEMYEYIDFLNKKGIKTDTWNHTTIES